METEILDKLYLELSQFTQAKTNKEIKLEKEMVDLKLKLDHAIRELKMICNITFNVGGDKGDSSDAAFYMQQLAEQAISSLTIK